MRGALSVIRIVRSPAAADRLAAAQAFIESFSPSTEILVIGASRDAADDLIRRVAMARGATFGLHAISFLQLAAQRAAVELARRDLAPSSTLGAEAVAARAIFEALDSGTIEYFRPIGRCPGFPAALAATLNELRLAGLTPDALGTRPGPGRDLAALLAAFEEQLGSASIADRATLFRLAADATRAGSGTTTTSAPLVFLDVSLDASAERQFVAALTGSSEAVLATVPEGDDQSLAAWESLQGIADPCPPASASSALARLRTYLFSDQAPPRAESDRQEVTFFSAPGESRECVEIARCILDESQNGLSFDRIAILLRSPATYCSLLEHALGRAGIPAYFTPGTRRPDPSGRAFLALLACAAEGLSSQRFAEYLSLGQVPPLDSSGAPITNLDIWVASEDETLDQSGISADARRDRKPGTLAQLELPFFSTDITLTTQSSRPTDESQDKVGDSPDSDDSPTLSGTLRTPWKWEKLLVEAAVIGGKARWERRLDGLDAELRTRLSELARVEPDSPRLEAIRRDLANLSHLRRFALPVIDMLASLPATATWADWLSRLERLAPTVLRAPERVLIVLADLRPMGRIGPVSLSEVAQVLNARLSTLQQDPPNSRYGRVLIATTEQARGRSFDVVFVPGLSERLFPQKPREDPLLLDELRRELAAGLLTQTERGRHERLLLRLAVGSARRHVYLSYPRIEVAESRPRVPSFYGLDVHRAITGQIPALEQLELAAAEQADARLAWPAPPDPARAIDDLEYDLATLRPFLRQAPSAAQGRARYLFELNGHLARSLRSQWAKWDRRWRPFDGPVRTTPLVAPLLQRHRVLSRPYSVSALQKFATCPYQFHLSAIHRLEPRQEPAPIQQLDPLTRGSMFHRVQAELMRLLEARALLPLSASRLEPILGALDETVDRVSEAFREELAPAVHRIWQDEVEAMRSDLRTWLRRATDANDGWEGIRFEFAFGLPADQHCDPRSVSTPVTLEGGYRLHGIVDLIERKRDSTDLRVTDYKTGVNRTQEHTIVGGGEVLQPVLYALAIEAAMGERVTEGRLSFCSAAGGFTDRIIPINAEARAIGMNVLETVDRAIDTGVLPPAPKPGACRFCDFIEVCGPHEEKRIHHKDQKLLEHLLKIRDLR